MMVSELIELRGKWNINLIQQSYLIPGSELILILPLSPFNHNNTWLWNYNKNGSYSVRSEYNLAVNTDKSGPSSSSEVLAIFSCPFSKDVWVQLEYSFLVKHKEDIYFNGVLIYTTELLEKDDFTKMLITTWGIWTERSKKTYGQHQGTPQQIKIQLSSYYKDVKNAHATEGGVFHIKELSNAGQAEVEFHDLALFVDALVSTPLQNIGLGVAISTTYEMIHTTLSKPLEGTLSVFHA